MSTTPIRTRLTELLDEELKDLAFMAKDGQSQFLNRPVSVDNDTFVAHIPLNTVDGVSAVAIFDTSFEPLESDVDVDVDDVEGIEESDVLEDDFYYHPRPLGVLLRRPGAPDVMFSCLALADGAFSVQGILRDDADLYVDDGVDSVLPEQDDLEEEAYIPMPDEFDAQISVAFDELSPELQKAIHEYLSEFGANDDLAVFVQDFVEAREAERQIQHLKGFQDLLKF